LTLWQTEFPNHPIFDDPLFETAENKRFDLDVRNAVATAIEEVPAIQRAIPAVGDGLQTMAGVIQNGQITHAQALRLLESEVRASSAISCRVLAPCSSLREVRLRLLFRSPELLLVQQRQFLCLWRIRQKLQRYHGTACRKLQKPSCTMEGVDSWSPRAALHLDPGQALWLRLALRT
jgi:hypothetical protein